MLFTFPKLVSCGSALLLNWKQLPGWAVRFCIATYNEDVVPNHFDSTHPSHPPITFFMLFSFYAFVMTLTVLTSSNITVNTFVGNWLKFAIEYDYAWDSVPIRIVLLY
jgi:hypothetical protein